MATTSNTYTGNGTNKLFSITFPYLETTDVDVYLNGTLQTITTQYTFANATTIQFVTAPANGATVLLNRSTNDAALQATFFAGSSIKAADLNLDFDQVLYISQETANIANTATTTANSATATANTALSNSATAISTANTASSNASAAVSTANTASTNASNAVTSANSAVTTANTANSTANTANSTANSAASTAASAVTTANTASTNASNAVTTANTASTSASNAVSTANTASTNASNAVTTANTAVTTANGAVTTANNAVTTANSAVTTANAADTKANQAIAAVASAILYTVVANVAAIPGSPANNTAIEVTDSTGIQSFTPLAGKPAGFVGSSGLSVRIVYSTAGSTWNWIQYFPNDPESRYLKLSGGALTGALAMGTNKVTGVGNPTAAQDAATKSYVDTADATKLNLSGGTMSGALAMGTNKVTGMGDPTLAQDAATKNYVDTALAGISSNSIQQGNSSVTVTDTGTGSVSISVDAITASLFQASGINFYQPLFQQGSLHLPNQNAINFWEATGNGLNSVGFKAPASITADVTWTLPATDGTSGQALKTNGSGTLSWGAAGGASGAGTDQVFYENDQTVTTNYTITTNKNAMTAGPVSINSGVVVTIPSGSTWVVV